MDKHVGQDNSPIQQYWWSEQYTRALARGVRLGQAILMIQRHTRLVAERGCNIARRLSRSSVRVQRTIK